MGAIADALRRKYRTPADALRALGFNPMEFGVAEPARGVAADSARDRAYHVELADAPGLKFAADSAARIGKDRMPRFTRNRRYAYDEELDREELKEIIDDPDTDFGDILAAVITQAPEDKQEEVHEAMRELSMDARGPRSWARDRMERRRYGRDQPPKFEGRPTTGAETEDRRRMAGDSAYNNDPRAEFERFFGPGAAQIERIG